MSYEVYQTEAFSEVRESLEKEEKDWIEKIILQLRENAFTGQQIRFPWFREKKYNDKRFYYLIYEQRKTVLLVAFGNKKDQDKIISHTIVNRERYKQIIEQT